MANRDGILAVEQSVCAALLGQAAVIRHILVALLADGHVLLESLPGLAKTRTVKALTRAGQSLPALIQAGRVNGWRMQSATDCGRTRDET